MSPFARYLALWVSLCILSGIAQEQFFPGVLWAIGSMEVVQVKLPVGLLIWVMVIPMLVKVDFGALGEVRQHVLGIGVTLFANWLVKPFSMARNQIVFSPGAFHRAYAACSGLLESGQIFRPPPVALLRRREDRALMGGHFVRRGAFVKHR